MLHPSKNLALYTLLDDFQRYGVTASLADEAMGIDQTFENIQAAPLRQNAPKPAAPEAKPEPQKSTSPEAIAHTPAPSAAAPTGKKASKTTSLPASKKDFAPEDALSYQTGELPFVVVLASEDAALDPLDLGDEQEQTLWQNMLKAIGVLPEGGQPSYLLVSGEASMDGSLSEEDEALLIAATQRLLAEKTTDCRAVFAVGGRAKRVVAGADGEEITLKKGCKTDLLTSYQLQAMLRQPALKRHAWAALLKLKEKMGNV